MVKASQSFSQWCKTNNPELLEQWDTSKNTIDPNVVGFGSHKHAWWICNLGHSWEAEIKGRCRGNGCPVCSGHSILAGFNDLESKFPNIAKEWHPSKNNSELPSQVAAYCNLKKWWLCPKGHDYDMKVQDRTRNGSNCPYCSHQRIQVGESDLKTTDPTLASEWHPTKNGDLTPEMVSKGSPRKV